MQVPDSVVVFLAGTLEAMTTELPKERIRELALQVVSEKRTAKAPKPPRQ